MLRLRFCAALTATVVATAASLAAATAGPPPTAGEIYAAIRGGETKRLTRWIAAGWDVNAATDERGNTPLIHAASVGNAEAVRVLIAAGANAKAANSLGVTPLLTGAADPVKAKLLVAAGADVNATAAGTGRTPLIVAANVNGNSATVKMLIDRGAEIGKADKSGMNALNAAASAGDFESVRLLIAKGADAAMQPPAGGTALHYAAGNRHVPMIRLLLERGAKVDAAGNFSNQVKHGKIALERITPLMLAVTYGPVDAVQALIDAGANVNARDIRGMTPLMFAVASESQDPAVVKLLLAKGAETGVRSLAGETALDWARKFNSAPVLALLGGGAGSGGETARRRAAEPQSEITPVNLPATIQRAVGLLQRSQTEFFRMSGCLACHHSVSGEMAVRAAREKGFQTDPGASEAFRKAGLGQAGFFAPSQLQLVDMPGAIDTSLYSLEGMAAAGVEPGPVTDALAVYVYRQLRDGSHWVNGSNGGLSRSPISEGSLHRTALAVRTLNRYLPPAYRAEYEAALVRVRAWVSKRAEVSTNDDAAMRLIAMKALGAPAADLAAAARALEKRQRADGGWSGNPNLGSDAYSTGLSLFALADAGFTASGATRRAAEYLGRTQEADGSWHVSSRAAKFQPYFESGFPHGGDQWISNAATSWAVMGLSAAAAAGHWQSR